MLVPVARVTPAPRRSRISASRRRRVPRHALLRMVGRLYADATDHNLTAKLRPAMGAHPIWPVDVPLAPTPTG